MKKTRENKGITLIALIITIIVMLILVGVTVNVALNGGLFDTAKTAAQKTNEAAQAEKEFGAYVSLVAKTDELVEDYPLNIESITEAGNIELADNNILLMYKEILQEYNIDLESLTLSQAIKTASVFYEIYNSEIEAHEETVVRDTFWSEFANPLVGKISIKGLSGDDEDVLLLAQLRTAYMFIQPALFSSNINTVEYTIFPNPTETFNTLKPWLDEVYPGGYLSIEELTGTAEIDLSMFAMMDGLGEICIMTEEIANRKILFIDGSNTVLDPKDYIGHAMCLISEQELGGDGSIQSGVDYAGTPLKNVLLINTQTGDFIYIDDDGQPNKPIY